jgi:alcohol dehydrogenase class IV
MVQSFTLEQPPLILFGPGVRAKLPGVARRLGSRLLLVTGSRWLRSSGWGSRLAELLADFQLERLECPAGEPEIEGLRGMLTRARELRPELIVAIGGGSVLDSAKALAGLLNAREPVEDFLEGVGRGLQLQGPAVSWIALPTTAGTGAEVTKNAVIRAAHLGAKKSLRSPLLLASAVLVDPEFAVGSPLALSGAAGMDALVQLVESYVSRKAAPVPRALAQHAFPVMLAALKAIPRDPQGLEPRCGAAYGALCSGTALANSGLGAAHGFASGLGGLYDIPHGLLCALFIRPVLRANADLVRSDCAALRASGRPQGTLRQSTAQEPKDPVEWLLAEFDALFELYGLPRDLKGFGVDPARIPEIAERSSGSSMSGNPRELSMPERERILSDLV